MNVSFQASRSVIANLYHDVLNHVDSRVKLAVFTAGVFVGMVILYISQKFHQPSDKKDSAKPQKIKKKKVSTNSEKMKSSSKREEEVEGLTPKKVKIQADPYKVDVFTKNIVDAEGEVPKKYIDAFIKQCPDKQIKFNIQKINEKDVTNIENSTAKKVVMLFTNFRKNLATRDINAEIEKIKGLITDSNTHFYLFITQKNVDSLPLGVDGIKRIDKKNIVSLHQGKLIVNSPEGNKGVWKKIISDFKQDLDIM